MKKHEKRRGFIGAIKDGLSYTSQLLSGGIFPSIAEGTDRVIKNIENTIEKRIIRRLYPLLIIGLGCMFLIFALFSYLKEFLGWSDTLAFFSTGLIIFVIGLLLKMKYKNRKDR